MPAPASRVSVAGLRQSDPTSLAVPVQDLLRQNLVRLEAGTLADIFALSELEDQLPRPLHRDLDDFAQQKVRELFDLPDGEPLLDVLRPVAALPSAQIPARLREAILRLDTPNRLGRATAALVQELEERWSQEPPEEVLLPTGGLSRIERPVVPERLRVPEEDRKKSTRRKAIPRPTPAAQRDTRRPAWIRDDILERLDANRERGLKESMLVAGVRHRSPFPDVSEREVHAELRRLKRDGEIKLTAGRWIRVKRLGW